MIIKKFILKHLGFIMCDTCNGWYDTEWHVMGFKANMFTGHTKRYCGRCGRDENNDEFKGRKIIKVKRF